MSKLTKLQLDVINDQLSNNENAADDELREFFREHGIREDYIKDAMSVRHFFLTNLRSVLVYNDYSDMIQYGELARFEGRRWMVRPMKAADNAGAAQ